ncbi:MAG TPA: hypothetical protein VE869_06105 [Gemmatimonas sp.]|nr:hypothetical protein [Gemmatimonas sp.]
MRTSAKLTAVVGATVLALSIARHQGSLDAQPTEPVFTKDVAPILYKNCASCHRPGGLGPFSLLDYDSAKANVADIKDAVKTGYMPPWHAEGPHGTFRNDRRLSELEKATIIRWIDGGAKRGDAQAMPAQPVFPAGWEMGTPDAVVTMKEEFTVPAAGTIEYQYFEVPTGFAEDKWVKAIEIMPGARDVVHHVLVYARPPAPAAPATPAAPGVTPTPAPRLFVNKPQYAMPKPAPRTDSIHGPPSSMGTLIGTTAPGTNMLTMPEGTAMRVRAGTVLVFQMHYTAHGHERHDRTSVGFRFAPAAPGEEMRAAAFANGALVLPAGAKNVEVPSELEPTDTITVWGLFPHTHLRGTRWKYTLEKPDGTSEIVLDVPRYDFNWQTYYFFTKPLKITPGSKLKAVAWYDNSATNPHNPDPKIDVKWGDQTWEEMQYTGFLYTVNSRRLTPAK